MIVSSRLIFVAALVCGIAITGPMISPANAYIDPGTTGMLSQLLYVLFYGILGVFLYCLRYIKQALLDGKQYLARFFGQKADRER
jgi:hypothetical protein